METNDKANVKHVHLKEKLVFLWLGVLRAAYILPYIYIYIAITNKDEIRLTLELLPTIIIYTMKINFVQFSGFLLLY